METGSHRQHSMRNDNRELLRLKIVTEANLDALIRVLQSLHAPQVTPLRVSAIRTPLRGGSAEVLEIEIDAAASDLAPEAFRLLLARINQLPLVLTTTG